MSSLVTVSRERTSAQFRDHQHWNHRSLCAVGFSLCKEIKTEIKMPTVPPPSHPSEDAMPGGVGGLPGSWAPAVHLQEGPRLWTASSYPVQLCVVGLQELAHVRQRHEHHYILLQRFPERCEQVLHLAEGTEQTLGSSFFVSWRKMPCVDLTIPAG